MKKLKLTSIIASILIVSSILAFNPICANALWKHDLKGWWNTEGNSWSVGWKEIDGKWYYFYSNGYMAKNTTIDGYYLNSSGVWTDSANDLLRQEILKNVSVQNPSFYMECSKSDININDVGNVFDDDINKLRITNPYEMYNLSKYSLSMSSSSISSTISITVNCTYKMTAEMEADLNTKASAIVASIATDNMSQSDKERAIHDWIVNNTQYDQSYTIYDPYNTLIKHTGVCEGYTLLAQKMFTLAGIKSTVVEGTAGGQAHAWNMVYIDNNWRHVDCTWDDPVSSEDILRYDYYNLTDKKMSVDHSWDTSAYPSTN